MDESDRRTEKAKQRLAQTQEELSSDAAEKLNRVNELAELFGKKLAEAEAAGNEGNVEESLRLMEEVDKIKKEKVAAEMEYRNSIPTSSYQQQKLRVCEVCSAYLGIQDNDRRLADHFGGKLHLGFITIREKLDELREIVEQKKKNGERERGGSSSSNSNSRRERGSREREQEDRRVRRRSRSRSPSDRNRRGGGGGDRNRDSDRGRRYQHREPRSDYRGDRHRDRDRY